MKLYELTEIYNNLMDLDLEDADLEIALKNITDEIEIKAENIGKILKDLDGYVTELKKEEERLYKIRKSTENRQLNLKKYLQSEMEKIDIKKIKTTLFSINIQKNAPSLKIIDESKIPEDYWIVEKKINKSDLKDAVKQGLFTDAAELVSTESLRIR